MSRLDLELVRRGLSRSRSQAAQLISSGRVRVNDDVARRPGMRVGDSDRLATQGDHYVSRAAHKLIGALDDLGLAVAGRALDAGASTGGFTQVLLERGCQIVYAVDVGSGQLNDSLRADPRVVLWEQTNLRDLDLEQVEGEPVDLVVADVSFISLVLLIDRLTAVVKAGGRLLLMIKPQFEVGRALLGKGGVVRSSALHRQAVDAVVEAAQGRGWFAHRVVASRLRGPAGNLEYFALFSDQPPLMPLDLTAAAGLVG